MENFAKKNIEAKDVNMADLNTLNRSINMIYKLELIPRINACTTIANAVREKKVESDV